MNNHSSYCGLSDLRMRASDRFTCTYYLAEGNICVFLPGLGNFTSEGNDEPNRVVETEMTQEEVEKFEEDWINMWNPEIDTTFFD